MNTPFLLLGVTLVFWGVQTGLLWVAVLSALLLEGSRLVDRRRIFAPSEFRRIVLLCDWLLLGICGYCLTLSLAGDYLRAGFALIQLLPVALLPLMVVQAYGTDAQLDMRKLSLYVSKKRATVTVRPPVLLNISYLFWGVSLLAASMTEPRFSWFYGGLCLLIAWGLWGRRPASSPAGLWLLLILCVSGVGWVGHQQLHRLQGKVEDGITRFLSGAEGDKNADPSRSITAMGRIDNLKLSGRILLRVTADHAISSPLLLREASYTTFRDATWMAGKSKFQTVQPGPGGDSWQLAPAASEEGNLQIAASLEDGAGLLPLPSGTTRITGLLVGELKLSRLGAVLVADGPQRLSYGVQYDPDHPRQGEPTELDLQVPAATSVFLAPIATRLGVDRQSPAETVASILDYFRRDFHYATVQQELQPDAMPLENFLLRSHSGHCEYFATATVLLLRTAGIPARYVTGYSVQEFSPWEEAYLVRSRHAHAWAEAYVDGNWRTLDTTPPSWSTLEESNGFGFQKFVDLWSWLVYRFSGMQLLAFTGKAANYLFWLLVPILLFFGYRLLRSQWQSGRRIDIQNLQTAPLPGADSEWYLLEEQLNQAGLNRKPLEKYGDWLERIAREPLVAGEKDGLARIVSLHCRYRFDPDGLSLVERQELRTAVTGLLRRMKTVESSNPVGGHPLT